MAIAAAEMFIIVFFSRRSALGGKWRVRQLVYKLAVILAT
jgi:hypothetical protein